MLGGEDRGHSRGRPVALPGLTTPGHGVIFHKIVTEENGQVIRIMLCHSRFSLEFLLCADGGYDPTGRPSDGSEWCVSTRPEPDFLPE